VADSIESNLPCFNEYFIIHEVAEPMKNPLYVATENATEELLRCPEELLRYQVLKVPFDFSFRMPKVSWQYLNADLNVVSPATSDTGLC
jgi:hypothetical protein